MLAIIIGIEKNSYNSKIKLFYVWANPQKQTKIFLMCYYDNLNVKYTEIE